MIEGTWLGNGKCKRSFLDPAIGDGQFAYAGDPVSMTEEYARKKWSQGRWAPKDTAVSDAWAEEAEAAQFAKAEKAAGFRRRATLSALKQDLKNPEFAAEIKALLGIEDKPAKGKKSKEG